MMREVVQGLVEAEAEGKRLVRAAREEADRVVAEAAKRAQEFCARARNEARADAEAMVESAVAEACLAKQQRLQKADAELRQAIRIDDATRARIVNAAVDCVCGHVPVNE